MGGGVGDYGTFFPVFAAAIARTRGPILEFGCGEYSTPLVHYMAATQGRLVVSGETDQKWFDRFQGYQIPTHSIVKVDDWDKFPGDAYKGLHWSVILVDHAPGERRRFDIERFKDDAQFVIAHDSETDYEAGGNYEYDKVIPLFKFKSEFRRYRPYTLILSNFEEFEITPCDQIWRPE